MIVAVTGAAGTLGRALTARLAQRGWEVRALVRDPGRFAPPPGVRVARCELPDAIDEAALAGADALVHGAWATRETDVARAARVNEEGTRRLLEASRRAGVRRFVFISSVVAHPEAPNYYGRSKHAMEQLLDSARDLVVRPGTILAREGQSIFLQMRDQARKTHVLPIFGGGKQPLQTAHVDDVCEAIARALERGVTGAINVAEEEPVEFGAFLRRMTERLGIRCAFVPLPFGPVLAVLRVVEALGLPSPLRSESLLGVKALRRVPVTEDLRRLELRMRTAEQSLGDIA